MFDAMHTPDNVLLVGGSSDIGVEIAKSLARRGTTRFVLAGRDLEAMQRSANAISSVATGEGVSVSVIFYDVVAEKSYQALLEVASTELETIDYAIFATGAMGDQDEDENSPASTLEILEINFSKLAPAILNVANHMSKQGFGQIVVLSSVAGIRVRRSNFIYGSAKAGLDGFAMALGESLIDKGVKVTVVRPGFVKTKMTSHLKAAPLSTTPEEVAKATLAATDHQNASVYVPSAIGLVIGVYRHLPRALARKIPF
ncbi:SDR family NAD(P)-dependent oxidoreductase [Acidithrix sp. C25]|uniref:SDR family NAD(P)-dependent oxidoreductase n=1 Tax=Acidithrix sp. C25 TaxID=1671482 RepID=UPI00191BC365|nr:SDR family NAD(P)-dependent oxidoreductase [Acidithrix sp. C25]